MSSVISSLINNINLYWINTTDWNEATNFIIQNFTNIQLPPSYVPCGVKLHLTRPKMRVQIRRNIHAYLSQFFVEYNYGEYRTRDDFNITFNDVETVIEKLVKIMVNKQRNTIQYNIHNFAV